MTGLPAPDPAFVTEADQSSLPDASPASVTLVTGTTAGGTGEHVRMLAAGLARAGTAVTVAGPSSADDLFRFAALPGVRFVPVEFAARPRPGDLRALARLGRTLAGARLVHAHGLRAGALTALALAGLAGGRTPGGGRAALVVTVHNAPPAGRVAALVYRLLERIAARRADLVLCVSPDLERRMRAAGARRTGPAVIAAPAWAAPGALASNSPAPGALAPESPAPGAPAANSPASDSPAPSSAARPAGLPPGRPLVLAVGRLAPQKGHRILIEAAATWQDLSPAPVVAIAGDGPLAADLRTRAATLGADLRFLGRRDDVPALLAAADVFVLPSAWEGQPLALQQALRAGAAIVAARAGGVPGLTGEDAALLVPPGDAAALAAAVRAVLCDPALASRLRAAARARGAALPGEDDAVAAALACYAAVAGRPPAR